MPPNRDRFNFERAPDSSFARGDAHTLMRSLFDTTRTITVRG